VPVPLVVPRAPVATRRAALGGVLATLAVVSACDVAQPTDPSGDASGGASGTGPTGASATGSETPAPTPTEDPDAALVDRVLVELDEVSALVTAAARFPRLRASMRTLGELHAAHRDALDGEPVTGRSPVAFAGAAEALRRVRAREQQTQRRLAGWAVAAESGALARLLASMSAGVAQQLAVLPAVLPAKAGAQR
jgi:hypothetical protein